MKVSEMIRRIKKKGCKFKRHGREHDIWYNPETGDEAQIPRHPSQELKTGTANKIEKDLGLK